MLPIDLGIENFYCHSKTHIDFSQFSAAVIVGKINGNDKFSNGSGKSTIFAAIKYALFNEVDTSSLDKVIKHNSEFCRITFIFQSSLDNQIYKIIRYRGVKTGTDVRLFRKINDKWEDLTQRKATDTEREILKLVKINYRTFCNSVLFSQGDLSGIAAMTPRERKTALKEALQLGVYSKYELTAKKKIADLVKELEKNQTLIISLGEPDKDIKELSKNIDELVPQKNELNNIINNYEEKINFNNEKLFSTQKELDIILQQSQENERQVSGLREECLKLGGEVKKSTIKYSELMENFKYSKERIDSTSILVDHLKAQDYREIKDIQTDLDNLKSHIAELHGNHKSLSSKLTDLRIPLPDEATCKHCRQSIDKLARLECQKEIDQEIKEIEKQIVNIKNAAFELKDKENTVAAELRDAQKYLDLLKNKEIELDKEKTNFNSIRTLLTEFEEMKNKKELEFSEKNLQLQKLLTEYSGKNKHAQLTGLKQRLDELKSSAQELIQLKKSYDEKLVGILNQEAVLTHRVEQKREDITKLKNLKENGNQLEYQHLLHQKVLSAFGANGIPSLITASILEDFQQESNSVLFNLRPGLQLQFLVEKERSDGDMADTLDIVYLLNNTTLEYSQLSGAQKLIVSLALRLGLAAIIRKRLGVDLKMILIDEADQSLDAGALLAFEQSIKKLQEDYKILLITHNNELKDKFTSTIVVEQDQYLNSTAKLLN